MSQALEGSSELRDALTDPQLPEERKSAILNDLLSGKTSPVSAAVVDMVVRAGRARDLPEIATAVAAHAAAESAKALAEVRSAFELDEGTLQRLQQALSQATGKTVEVRNIVDPDVIGGIVARIGDTVIDGSLRGRLQDLKEQLSVGG